MVIWLFKYGLNGCLQQATYAVNRA